MKNQLLILKRYFPILLFSLIMINCNEQTAVVEDPFSHISDQAVVETLKKSFNAAGGLENWQNIKDLKYKKHSTLLFESGEVENDVFQNHHYNYEGTTKIEIKWKNKEDKSMEMVSIDGVPDRFIEGEKDTSATVASLKNSITTSLFVISIPYKLIDKGVVLSHEGETELETGEKVEVIKAVYNPDTHAHHTTPDIWWYYFDKESHQLLGYMVKHLDHHSYVKNLEFAKAGPFTFPAKRVSYRVSPEREILYERARYEYSTWKVEL